MNTNFAYKFVGVALFVVALVVAAFLLAPKAAQDVAAIPLTGNVQTWISPAEEIRASQYRNPSVLANPASASLHVPLSVLGNQVVTSSSHVPLSVLGNQVVTSSSQIPLSILGN